MNFQQAIIKDLAWLISSPALITAEPGLVPEKSWFDQEFENILPRLVHLDTHPKELEVFKNSIKPVVGDYFEKLVELWLKLNPNIQQLKQHQIVFENRRTIGEFDFLFTDKYSHQSFHWEVAVKFYLQWFNGETYEFLGPNAKDSLAKKTDKMFKQQLQLSHNPNANEILADYTKPIQTLGILKGMLFYPSKDNWQIPDQLPANIPQNHLRGWWSQSGSLYIPQQSEDSRWFILQKPYWLTVHPDKLGNPYDFNKLNQCIEAHFKQHIQPLLLAEVMQNNNGNWLEVSRGFIVSEHWPNSR